MRTRKVRVTNNTGLHARPATELIKLSKRFESRISIKTEDAVIPCGNIFKLLGAGITCGTEVEIEADGEDEEEAVEQIAEYIENIKE